MLFVFNAISKNNVGLRKQKVKTYKKTHAYTHTHVRMQTHTHTHTKCQIGQGCSEYLILSPLFSPPHLPLKICKSIC